MNGNAWTKEQLDYLQLIYGRFPVTSIQQKMLKRFGVNRSRKAIELKASRLMLSHAIQKGYVRLAWVHPHGTNASRTIVKAAKAAGVARRQGGSSGNPWIAPEEWVDEYMRTYVQEHSDPQFEEIKNTWLLTTQVARIMGIDPQHAANNMISNNTRIAKVMRDVRRHRFMTMRGQPWYWHPGDVEKARLKWEAVKKKPKAALGWRWISEDVQSVREGTRAEAA